MSKKKSRVSPLVPSQFEKDIIDHMVRNVKKSNLPKKLSIWCDQCGKHREIVYRLQGRRGEFNICNRCLKDYQVVE